MTARLSEGLVSNRLDEKTLVLPNDEHNQRLVQNVHPPDWVTRSRPAGTTSSSSGPAPQVW